MYRTDAADNVANEYSDGDPGSGREGTIVEADHLNAIQEELCNVIEGMGLTLSKVDSGQLLAAILRLLERVNTWTALQKLAAALEVTGGGVSLTQAALQSIRKTGGKLQVGTGSAHDLELLRGDEVLLALVAAGLDARNKDVLNVARIGLQNRTTDPSSGSMIAGTIWFRSGRARLCLVDGASSGVSVQTEDRFGSGIVNGTTGAITRNLGGMTFSCSRISAGLYRLLSSGIHNGVVTVTPIYNGFGADLLARVYSPGVDQMEVRIAEQDGSPTDVDFMFHARI